MQGHIFNQKGRPYFKTASQYNPVRSLATPHQIHLEDAEENKQFDPSATPYTLVWSNGAQGDAREVLEIPVESPDERKIKGLEHISDSPEITVMQKRIRGEWRYFCHIPSSIEAPPNPNIEPQHGVRVGIDIGPTTVAIYNEHGAYEKRDIVAPLDDRRDEIANLQRAIDRTRRANNDAKFRDDGTVRTKSSWNSGWIVSEAQKDLEARLSDVQRQLKEHRKRIHESLANDVLEYGTDIVVEDNPYKAWQKGLFGRSIHRSAPSMFIDILTYKARALDGEFQKVSTWETKLSQQCVCGDTHDKDLQTRTHRCETYDLSCDRDLFRRFLPFFRP